MKRKICVFTGSRAEYGLLRPLLEEIKSDKSLQLQIIASGMHLSSEFGLTYKAIEQDGFKINEKIEILLSSDTPVGISKSIGLGMIAFSEVYERLKPDLIVVLGDRFDLLSPVSAALVSRIPVAHIAGGALTEGAFDNAVRHSITKMSHLHFTTTQEHRKRVIQLGENPRNVFNVGALGVENIKRLKLLSKKTLEKRLKFKFNKRNLSITFHPVTLEDNTSEKQFHELLSAVDGLKHTNIIFTKTNADTYGRIINEMIDEYVTKNAHKAVSFISMGQLLYLSALQFVDGVLGNSSSGIIEAPSFKIGTINIGDRQKGRIAAKSVINCQPTKKSIEDALKELYSDDFRKRLHNIQNPYDCGGGSKEIKKILKKCNLKNIVKKIFYDIEFTIGN